MLLTAWNGTFLPFQAGSLKVGSRYEQTFARGRGWRR